MMMERYAETFYVQDRVLRNEPFDEPWDMQEVYTDGHQIRGVFLQSGSNEAGSADGDTIRINGRFVTEPNAPVRAQMTIRRESDNMYFRLSGEALRAPEQAFARLKVFAARAIGGAGYDEWA